MSRCPYCKKFMKNVVATVNGLDEITLVTGECKKHGKVKADDWSWDDFFPNPHTPPNEEE